MIGRTLRGAGPEEAEAGVFGYTCVNDITASDILNKDASFAQWTRAKSYDGFSPLGPAILTGVRPETLSVRTVLNGSERQNYPVSDMVFSVPELVSRLSRDVTLEPGRRDLLRHVGGGRGDAGGAQHGRGDDRGRGDAADRLRERVAGFTARGPGPPWRTRSSSRRRR